MAKVTGPLMSMDARGGFAGTIVFTAWKGRNVVRQLVQPSNPKSADQEAARNAIRVLGAGQRFANLTAEIRSGETETDKALLITAAPAGQAWNGYLVKSAIGAGQIQYDAASTAWAALSSPEKSAWHTAAAGLTPVIDSTAQTDAGGTPGIPMTSGETFFHYVWGLYIAGVSAIPGAVPPVYA